MRAVFRGTYFNKEDSVWLLIKDKEVVLTNQFSGIADDSTQGYGGKIEIGGDSSKDFQLKVETKGNSDSLEVDASFEETVLNINHGGVAKFFRGYYFLNKPIEGENSYRLRILQLDDKGLNMLSIQSDSVLHTREKEGFIKRESQKDSEQEIWTLNPSRKQLRKLMTLGLFSGNVRFERVGP